MTRLAIATTFIILTIGLGAAQEAHPPATAAATTQTQVSRDATREKLRAVLNTTGPKVNIDFRQSDKNPYNFTGVLRTGLTNADFMEIVVSVSNQETIHFRIYPHYKDAYINIDRAANRVGLERQLLRLSDTNFLFWGADDSGDIFAGYTFTLESGFPEQAINVVLYSIKPLDKFVGEMKPMLEVE
jgi:hypothetical protein